MASGLCSFISNPNSARIQEALHTTEVLLNRDPQAERYIGKFSDWTSGQGSQPRLPLPAHLRTLTDSRLYKPL